MEYPVQFSVDYRSRNTAPAMTHTRTNNQVTDEGVQLSLSPGDALASMQEGGKLGAVMLVLDHRAYLEDSFQLTAGPPAWLRTSTS